MGAFLTVFNVAAGMTIESHPIDQAFPVNPAVTLNGAFPAPYGRKISSGSASGEWSC